MHMMTCQILVLGQNTRGVTELNIALDLKQQEFVSFLVSKFLFFHIFNVFEVNVCWFSQQNERAKGRRKRRDKQE